MRDPNTFSETFTIIEFFSSKKTGLLNYNFGILNSRLGWTAKSFSILVSTSIFRKIYPPSFIIFLLGVVTDRYDLDANRDIGLYFGNFGTS